MTVHHAIWTVGAKPAPLARAVLPSEKALEGMIVAVPEILSDSWMLVGRQEKTAHGGIIDLLAIAPDGALVIIELKRGRTPRDVVAQALDYASWVEGLEPDVVAAIYRRFAPGRSLAVAAGGFTLRNAAGEERPALEVLTEANYHREHQDDLERCEWFVPV